MDTKLPLIKIKANGITLIPTHTYYNLYGCEYVYKNIKDNKYFLYTKDYNVMDDIGHLTIRSLIRHHGITEDDLFEIKEDEINYNLTIDE